MSNRSLYPASPPCDFKLVNFKFRLYPRSAVGGSAHDAGLGIIRIISFMSSSTRELIHKLVVSLSRLGRAILSEFCLLAHPAILYSRKCRFAELRVYQLSAFSLPYSHPNLSPILSHLFYICYLLCSLLAIFRYSKIRIMDAYAELPSARHSMRRR